MALLGFLFIASTLLYFIILILLCTFIFKEEICLNNVTLQKWISLAIISIALNVVLLALNWFYRWKTKYAPMILIVGSLFTLVSISAITNLIIKCSLSSTNIVIAVALCVVNLLVLFGLVVKRIQMGEILQFAESLDRLGKNVNEFRSTKVEPFFKKVGEYADTKSKKWGKEFPDHLTKFAASSQYRKNHPGLFNFASSADKRYAKRKQQVQEQEIANELTRIAESQQIANLLKAKAEERENIVKAKELERKRKAEEDAEFKDAEEGYYDTIKSIKENIRGQPLEQDKYKEIIGNGMDGETFEALEAYNKELQKERQLYDLERKEKERELRLKNAPFSDRIANTVANSFERGLKFVGNKLYNVVKEDDGGMYT
jgi:hypothetical protein